jgi:hypothetical protein
MSVPSRPAGVQLVVRTGWYVAARYIVWTTLLVLWYLLTIPLDV